MTQAILTKYVGPTNSHGSKVSAAADAGRVVISWDGALDIEGNHRAAAIALAVKLGWGYMLRKGMVSGTLPGDSSRYVHTFPVVGDPLDGIGADVLAAAAAAVARADA